MRYTDEERISVCCAYPMYDDTDICSGCKDHSAVMEDEENEE